jgi:anthranilate phosphoribosyltransferase
MILVIDNYDSFTYNLVQLLAALGAEVEVRRNDSVTADEALAMQPAGIVISPGPGTPDDAGISRDVVRAAAEKGVPVMGVCLGHQAIAEVFGGRVCRSPRPVHGKTDDISHDGTGLFTGVPNPFTATRYHSLCVAEDSILAPLHINARTPDGVVMGIQHETLPVFGVQFHPESVLTPEGAKVLANFLDVTGEVPLSGELSGTPQVLAAAGGTSRASAEAAEVENIGQAIARIAAGDSITEAASYRVMDQIMSGEATPSQISALIVGMRMKGETVDEIVGFARAMRDHATPVRPTVKDYVDIVGTGGDGLHTFNISTTTTFVVAGAGVPVAKHGNRAVSSSAGAADVLEALGIDITLGPADIARCVDEVGVGFLFAQSLHASMRHAGPTRREIGIRTVFNILGPLTNPAGAKRELLGVYDPKLAPVLAEVAGRLGAERVLAVYGHPGMDEVSCSGPTTIAEFNAEKGGVEVYEITPESIGLARGTLADIAGGDGAENALIVRSILAGDHGPRRDIVLANSAAALLAAGKAADFPEGIAIARESIDSGRAQAALDELIALTTRLGEAARAAAGQEGQ